MRHVWTATGALAGIALALVALSTWQVPRGTGVPRGALTFTTWPTGELEVRPGTPFLEDTDLRPRAAAGAPKGAFTLRNQTPVALGVRFRARPSIPDLDGLLRVRIGAAGRTLYTGSLGDLRRWTARSLALRSGQRARVEVRAWVPESARDGYQGRIADVTFELRSRR